MHKDGKWARQILSLQDDEGKWGWFHSLAQVSGVPMTTEQALGRLEILGFAEEDPCIRRALAYMEDCLAGRKEIPDRREKVHDWDIFTSLMLAARIRRFTDGSERANRVAAQWAEVLTAAFASGEYDGNAYAAAYCDILGMRPHGGRLVDFVNFYPLSLLRGCLDADTEAAMLDHVLAREDGIYYVYGGCMGVLPDAFADRRASRYLSGLELLAPYGCAPEKLAFAADWLDACRSEDGGWDMGPSVRDGMYFPLSDDWRKKGAREADCTERIGRLLDALRRGRGLEKSRMPK